MSALALRIIACVSMLLDHIGYCFGGRYPCLEPLRWIGRIAFPLYVFLIVNGFRHTSNRPRYALRLAIFAVISQVPFALLFHHRELLHAIDVIRKQPLALITRPPAQTLGTLNVFVTLLIALLTVWATDEMRKHRVTKYLCFLPTLAVYAVYYFGLLKSDYGAKGILLAMTFYLIDLRRFSTPGKKIAALFLTAVGMVFSIFHNYFLHYPISSAIYLLQHLRGKVYTIAPLTAPTKWQLTQLFALLALVYIFFYNGKKGRFPASRCGAKAVQLGFYLFYPVHILVLYGLKLLLR